MLRGVWLVLFFELDEEAEEFPGGIRGDGEGVLGGAAGGDGGGLGGGGEVEPGGEVE